MGTPQPPPRKDPQFWKNQAFLGFHNQRHTMKTIIFLLILSVAKHRGFEITGGSDDPLIVAGERLELACDIEGDFNFCQWSYSDAWSCLTYSNALDEELPCEDQERATITASEGSCTLGLEDVTLEDIGEYKCMTGKLEGGEVLQSVNLINVEVAMPASIEFGGDIADVEEKWMLIEDDALDESMFEELANGDDERLIDITKEFTFTPSRDDCGKYLKCSAKQVNGDGELLIEDVPQIFRKIMVVI